MIDAMKKVNTPEEKTIANAKLKDPEEKRYLILFVYTDDSEYPRGWEMVTGRTAARETIIENAEIIDVDESHILVEGNALGTEVSVYDFMKHVERYFDDTFDIDDYVTYVTDSYTDDDNDSDENIEYDDSDESNNSTPISSTIDNNTEGVDI